MIMSKLHNIIALPSVVLVNVIIPFFEEGGVST